MYYVRNTLLRNHGQWSVNRSVRSSLQEIRLFLNLLLGVGYKFNGERPLQILKSNFRNKGTSKLLSGLRFLATSKPVVSSLI